MKILLISTLTRLRKPGRHIGSDTVINEQLKDSVRVCYEVCDEARRWITVPPGRKNDDGYYVEHPEEAAMKLRLQKALGAKKLAVVTYPTPDGRVRFEAVRAFPCEVEVEIEA